MEPHAIWIYHPDGRNSFERITPEDANAKGWAINPDFSDLKQESIVPSAQEAEPALEAKSDSPYICDTCGKVCTNAIGLAGHKRSHK